MEFKTLTATQLKEISILIQGRLKCSRELRDLKDRYDLDFIDVNRVVDTVVPLVFEYVSDLELTDKEFQEKLGRLDDRAVSLITKFNCLVESTTKAI